MKLGGRATIEGEWAGRVTGLASQRVEIAMLVTPDGHSRLELSRFLTPPIVADHEIPEEPEQLTKAGHAFAVAPVPPPPVNTTSGGTR